MLPLSLKALDAAMKQYKAQSPNTACIFFSVDEDLGKIFAMSCVPKVGYSRDTTTEKRYLEAVRKELWSVDRTLNYDNKLTFKLVRWV